MWDVPPVVRNKALAVGAVSWLDGLPALMAGLEEEWSIAVGRPFAGATEAFVAPAVLADATPAVVKLVIPRDRDAAACEIETLRLADGDGCAQLLRADARRGALLVVSQRWRRRCP